MAVLMLIVANVSVLLVLSVSMRLLGIDDWLVQQGMSGQMTGLMIMAAIFGFGGAFISLAISKWMAKRSMGVKLIEEPSNETERWLISIVKRQAENAGIKMPEVGIFPAKEPNAFATGMRKNSSLVAVSAGLLQHMSKDEVEAVLGHEISHVANGDMVTMTLLQGVLNTFVIFLSRVIGMIVDKVVFKSRSGMGPGYWITTIVAQLILGLFAAMIAMWFSRWREYRADAGGAKLAGRFKMIGALQALQRAHPPQDMPEQLAAFGINAGIAKGFKKLFLSHPPLEERIAALQRGTGF